MKARRMTRFVAVLAVLALASCATPQPEVITSSKSTVELRSMQSRAFETGNNERVYRAVLATLQDLGYTVTELEPEAGTATGDKLARLKLTVSVYSRGATRTIVRANAIVKLGPQVQQGHQVDAPEFYQKRFFEPLSKALFLEALLVEDADDEG
jgi:hypothetical protein